MKPLHSPWVSVRVRIVQYFLLIFLLKIQTLLCNVFSLVLVLDFSLSEFEECHLLIDSSLQYFFPLPSEGSHSSASLISWDVTWWVWMWQLCSIKPQLCSLLLNDAIFFLSDLFQGEETGFSSRKVDFLPSPLPPVPLPSPPPPPPRPLSPF